jgi:hypothetical protein
MEAEADEIRMLELHRVGNLPRMPARTVVQKHSIKWRAPELRLAGRRERRGERDVRRPPNRPVEREQTFDPFPDPDAAAT